MSKITQIAFVEGLAARVGVTATEAEKFVRKVKSYIYQILAKGHTVELSGFGQFSVSHRDARIGFNPQTRKSITIRELNTPKFRAGLAFKEAVKLKK